MMKEEMTWGESRCVDPNKMARLTVDVASLYLIDVKRLCERLH